MLKYFPTHFILHRYIDSHPAWGKHLEARLAPGEHVITFRARSPNSNVNVVCRTIITVKGNFKF